MPCTTTTTSTPLSRKITPTSQPISVLATPAARLYTHIHPVLLLSLFCLAFPALVADPVSALQRALFPLSILQLFYTILCLPTSARRSGLFPNLHKAASKPRPTKRPSAPKISALGARIIVRRILPRPQLSLSKLYSADCITLFRSNPSSHSCSLSFLQSLFSQSPSSSSAARLPHTWLRTCFAPRTWRCWLCRRSSMSMALTGPCGAKFQARVYPLTRYGAGPWGPW